MQLPLNLKHINFVYTYLLLKPVKCGKLPDQGSRKHLKTSPTIGVVNGCGIELMIFICSILHKELQLYRYYM